MNKQATTTGSVDTPIVIVTRGSVSHRARERLRAELAHVAAASSRRTVAVRAELDVRADRRDDSRVVARARVALPQHLICAHAEARGTREATDLLARRLRRSLRDLHDRDGTRAVQPAARRLTDTS
jgi:hypothetical protein